MLGLSRLAYSLATNRQIPSAIGPPAPERSHAVRRDRLRRGDRRRRSSLPRDLDFLVGIYAFGALLALTIAHLSICVLRYREPDRTARTACRSSIRVRGGDLPLPAVLGALMASGGAGRACWSSTPARGSSGLVWMAFGLALYVIYRTTPGASRSSSASSVPRRRCSAEPVRRRVRVDPRADPRHAARRRHRPDRRPSRRAPRTPTTRGSDGRDDRGALGLRGADVAAARRAPARRAARARARRRWRGRRRWGRSTRASRSRPRPSARAGRGQAIVDEATPPRRRADRAGRRGAVAASAAARVLGGAAARSTTSSGMRRSTSCARRPAG